jgi:hypothetical protein
MKAAVQRVSENGSLVAGLAVRQRPNVVTVEGDETGNTTAASAHLQTSRRVDAVAVCGQTGAEGA